MPEDPAKHRARNQRYHQSGRYAARMRERTEALKVKLGGMCDWRWMGDCHGPLQLHHKYGHADDDRPWRIGKYERLFAEGKLGLLCRRHNILDGIERREIFRRQKKICRHRPVVIK